MKKWTSAGNWFRSPTSNYRSGFDWSGISISASVHALALSIMISSAIAWQIVSIFPAVGKSILHADTANKFLGSWRGSVYFDSIFHRSIPDFTLSRDIPWFFFIYVYSHAVCLLFARLGRAPHSPRYVQTSTQYSQIVHGQIDKIWSWFAHVWREPHIPQDMCKHLRNVCGLFTAKLTKFGHGLHMFGESPTYSPTYVQTSTQCLPNLLTLLVLSNFSPKNST